MSFCGLQEAFLNGLRRDHIPATFFFTNGYQMKGVVRAFDPYTLLVESGGQQKLLFKHGLTTVIPETPVDLSAAGEN